MLTGSRMRIALAALLSAAVPLAAQPGSGEGFLFRPSPGSLTIHGGLAAPFATGGVHRLATENLTVDRGDFRAGAWGADLAFAVHRRADVVLGVQRSHSSNPSEFRDWVDTNDQPIEQVTRFRTTPIVASVRWYLAERGRRVGTIAWIPTRFVPFVSLGGGVVNYRFEQFGDFVDTTTLNIFSDRLVARGITPAAQLGAGAQWGLNQRWVLTGEVRYLRAKDRTDGPDADFVDYDINLSGLSTLIGLTVRF